MNVFQIKDYDNTLAICISEKAVEKWLKDYHKSFYDFMPFEEFESRFDIVKTFVFEE